MMPGDVLASIVLLLVGWALPIALFAFIVYALVRYFNRPSARRERDQVQDPALDVLRQRYARGEIDSTEYEERRRTLGG